MNHTNPPFSTEKSPNPPPNEDYIYDLSNSFSINEIFNNDFNSSEMNESENLYDLIMIKPKSINKGKIIFKTEQLQKREGESGIKILKKMSIPLRV